MIVAKSRRQEVLSWTRIRGGGFLGQEKRRREPERQCLKVRDLFFGDTQPVTSHALTPRCSATRTGPDFGDPNSGPGQVSAALTCWREKSAKASARKGHKERRSLMTAREMEEARTCWMSWLRVWFLFFRCAMEEARYQLTGDLPRPGTPQLLVTATM